MKENEKNALNPLTVYPLTNNETLTYIKPTIHSPHIIAGDYSYYFGKNFEAQVKYLYKSNKDNLIIGRYCQIAEGVTFIMNGANHQLNSLTTYPFFIFDGWQQDAPSLSDLQLRGDTVIGSDVWIGQNATILPGVHIGDGVIIGLNSTVASDIPAYTVAVGNPARVVRKRFSKRLTSLLLKLKWWDKSAEEVKSLLSLLTETNLKKAEEEIEKLIEKG